MSHPMTLSERLRQLAATAVFDPNAIERAADEIDRLTARVTHLARYEDLFNALAAVLPKMADHPGTERPTIEAILDYAKKNKALTLALQESESRGERWKREAMAGRELLTARGDDALLPTRANEPWRNDYAVARALNDQAEPHTQQEEKP